MVAPANALAAMPDELSALDAAPLLCAGVTTFNALRHSGAMPGDVVAVLGIGGLGHLGVQFANKLGFRTVAIARGSDKEALSRKLGAHHFIERHRRRRGEAQPPWRCAGGVGDGDERQGDDTGDRGAGSKRPTDRCGRRCRADRGFVTATDWCQPQRCRSLLRCVDRLAGHPRFQRAIRRASDDRDNAAFARPRSLRTDDARRGALPNGVDDGRAALAVSGPGDNSFRSCYSIDISIAGSEAGLLLGAFRIKGAAAGLALQDGSVLILPPMLAVNITKSN